MVVYKLGYSISDFVSSVTLYTKIGGIFLVRDPKIMWKMEDYGTKQSFLYR